MMELRARSESGFLFQRKLIIIRRWVNCRWVGKQVVGGRLVNGRWF